MAETTIAPGLRVLRHVAPPEAPWEARVARDADGRLVALVDAALAPLGEAWASDPSGHLAAPRDVERRPDGHDLVLPYCPLTLRAYLADRQDARPLAAGEAVTLFVSILRGLRERHVLGVTGGTWWLTDEGMPLLAPDGGDDTDEVLETLGALAPVLLAEVGSARDRLAHGERPEDREREVFALAPPAPLCPPSRRSARGSLSAVASSTDSPGARGRPRWLDGLVDTDLAALWTVAVESVLGGIRTWLPLRRGQDADGGRAHRDERERRNEPEGDRGRRLERGRRRSRRGLLWVGAGCAALVLAVGLAWPAGDRTDAPASSVPSATDTSERAGGQMSARDAAASAPSSAPGAGAAASGNPSTSRSAAPADAAAMLLRSYVECPGGCADLVEGGRALSVSVPTGEATVTLVEEFGDVAVVRAAYASGAILVVIARHEQDWRVRDAYAADPPV